MDARFSLALVGVIVVAVAIGVIAARSQPPISTALAVATATPTAIPIPAAGHVEIIDNPTGSSPPAYYVPPEIVVRVGTRVTWVNGASAAYTVTADRGSFSAVLSPHETFHWTPHHAGTYMYGDFNHPDMHGVVVVQR